MLSAFLVLGLASCATTNGPQRSPQETEAQKLIQEVSIFLPEASRGGGPGQGGPGGSGDPSGVFQRDESLFLSKDQVAKVLPILTALKAKSSATAEDIKKARLDTEILLTDAQKAEYKVFQAEMEKMEKQMSEAPKQGPGGMGQPGGQPPGGQPGGGPGGGQGGPGGGPGGPGQGGPQWQQQVESLIKALEAYAKKVTV